MGFSRTFRDDVAYYSTSATVSPTRLAPFQGSPKTTGTHGPPSRVADENDDAPAMTSFHDKLHAVSRPPGLVLQASPVPLLPRVLHFESWWTECTETGDPFQGIEVCRSQERQYVVLQFNPKSRSFLVQSRGLAAHVDDSELTSSRTTPMTATPAMETTVMDRQGRALEEWDLHVGAELRIFGRTVTLRKCNGETMRWLDYQARRLIRTKMRLEKELGKFCFVSFSQPRHAGLHAPLAAHITKGMSKHDPYVAHQSKGTEVALGGRVNLRQLVNEVEYLQERLAAYRPLRPADKDIDHALTARAAAAVAAAQQAEEEAMAALAGGIRALPVPASDVGADAGEGAVADAGEAAGNETETPTDEAADEPEAAA